MSAHLAIAAATALAFLGMGRRGSRSTRHHLKTLWVGTSERNIRKILKDGLVPSGGYSPHRTKNSGAVFLTDSDEAALMYGAADPQYAPVLIEVDVDGLDLVPDTDDIGADMTNLLADLNAETGIELNHGDLIPSDLVDDVSAFLEEVADFRDEKEAPIFAEVQEDDDGYRLMIRPVVLLPMDTSAFDKKPEMYDDAFFQDGEPKVSCEQWQHVGTIPVDRFRSILVQSRRYGTIEIENKAFVELDCNEVEPGDLLDGRTSIEDLIGFKKYYFERMTVDEAKKWVKRREIGSQNKRRSDREARQRN